ncbi:hypothetical protein HYALB_00000376 [Hymenoscyphus albidus]|uniref:Xylanolytic transcriptional activator regulatory domain-containing protein n=1 Tax=Hymenoscyphus albidus TaxID=595503 RepID=A0A9N9LGI6_9HELO|nr:hypothetical protein HYALB_00000376 [Hymenoscyphus albidus]
MPAPQQPKRRDRPCDACVIHQLAAAVPGYNPNSVVEIADGAEKTEETKEISSSSAASRKSHKRVIRTISGTGVEEYDKLSSSEPSLLKRTLGLKNNEHSKYVGATAALEPSFLSLSSNVPFTNTLAEVRLGDGTLRRISLKSTDSFLLHPDAGTQGYAEELSDLDSIEAVVSPHGKALINLYFRIVFPSFPMLHKEVYLEKYSRSYREFSPPLLAAVYLHGLHYWTFDDSLSKFSKPDPKILLKLARKSLGNTIHRPKLSLLQAGLLLLQYTDTDSAELTAQMVSVSYGLGLHLDPSDFEIPDWEKGLRKRLAWALYMQDKWGALIHGRPPLINSSNWAVPTVSDVDFPENQAHEDEQEGSSEVEKGRILFTQMICLSEILADLLEGVFSIRSAAAISAAGNGLSLVLEKVKPAQIKLREWFSNLPECLSMGSTQILKLNAVGYLRLAYIATEITIHRRIILALTPSVDLQLHQICRSVARERFIFAMDFVQSLKPQHLSSFWYFASPQNFALIGVFGTLLLSTATNEEEVGFYRTALKEYRWTLKINSENGARYMKPAMTLLDANMTLLKESSQIGLTSEPQQLAKPPEALSAPHQQSCDVLTPAHHIIETPCYQEEDRTSSNEIYSPDSLNAEVPHDFNYELEDSNLWRY